MNFPENPKDGDTVKIDGKKYKYNAYEECWNRVDATTFEELVEKVK